MRNKSRAALTAGLGTVLSLSIATSAAALTGLDIGDGSLEYKGLKAIVPVSFTCDAGADYQGYVYVRQIAQQRAVTEAGNYIGGECTGELQTVYVRMLPSLKPFKKGSALGFASLVAYCFDPEVGGSYQCGEAVVENDEIQLRVEARGPPLGTGRLGPSERTASDARVVAIIDGTAYSGTAYVESVVPNQEGKIMRSKSRAALTACLGTVLSLSIATSAAAAITDLDIGSGTLNNKGLTATSGHLHL